MLFASNEAYSTRGRRHIQARAFTPLTGKAELQAEKQQKVCTPGRRNNSFICEPFPFFALLVAVYKHI